MPRRAPQPTLVIAGDGPVPPGRHLQRLLDALTAMAEAEVRSGLPAYWQARWIRYRREPSGSERWAPPSVVLRRGWGDCEDLAAWLAGSLRAAGRDARAVLRRVPTGWHVVVRDEDGRVYDPSRERGMR